MDIIRSRIEARGRRIMPFLWFDGQAEDAARFYTSIFKKSRIRAVTRYGQDAERIAGRPAGSVMTVAFQLEGQEFVALNGGPQFQFNKSISFVVNCRNQREIDDYWKKLSAGGREVQCGWLDDKFGLSWQIVPVALGKWLADRDPEKSQRVMAAMLKMVKLDLAALAAAYGPAPGKARRQRRRR